MNSPPTISNQRSPIGAPRQGFALPMTILAVAGLTLLLIGLMTVLTLERKTARSYSDSGRADLAVESGLAVALASLSEIAKRDDSIVFRIEDPVEPTIATSDRPLGFREQFFTYGALYGNGRWRGIPLFSGAAETSLGSREILVQNLSPILTGYVKDIVPLGKSGEYDQNVPRAKWVEVPATDPKEYSIRYAFWIEDLSGRIDGRNVGTGLLTERHAVSDLDVTTIFHPEKETGDVPPILAKDSPTNKQKFLRSPGSLRAYMDGALAKRFEPFVYFPPSLPAVKPPKLVPMGFGYKDEGKPAGDLNLLVESADLSGIAQTIDDNLPDLKTRKGGRFPAAQDYVKTLAASIIDYADTDSNATVNSQYRGVDSYPFVTELSDRYEWLGKRTDNPIKISVETYIELWNPTQKEISGDVSMTNVNNVSLKIPPATYHKFTPVAYPSVGIIKIPANGYKVLMVGAKTYEFPQGAAAPLSVTFEDPTSDNPIPQTTQNSFELKWNGVTVDLPRGGLQKTSGTLNPGLSQRKWKGNSGPILDFSVGQRGDPRASYYISNWVFGGNYDEKSNWGGRMKTTTFNSNYNEVRITDWPDGGSNTTPGIKAGSDAKRPTELTFQSASKPNFESDYAPAYISNAGRYDSLAELGNIFDPAQVLDPFDRSSSTFLKRLGLDMIPGGGMTLAIGRPEFPAFDVEGKRSAQILDLFSVSPPDPATNWSGARVNINTAPREVLRSLVAGVELDADPLFPDLALKKNPQVGDIFADYVIAQRAVAPLRGPSDLNMIRIKPSVGGNVPGANDLAFFGELKHMDGAEITGQNQLVPDDAGREQLLGKVMDLVKFDSKNFRIVVKGEALDPKGRVIGRASREYFYSVEPVRDSGGLVIPGEPVKFSKYYEKTN